MGETGESVGPSVPVPSGALQRRAALLESLSLGLMIWCGIFFGAYVVGDRSLSAAALYAGVLGLTVTVGWSIVRWKVPPRVKRLGDSAEEDAEDEDEGEGEGEGGWDVTGLLLAVLVVPAFTVLALLFVHWPLVLIVIGFAAQSADPSLLQVVVALGASLAVLLAFELTIVYPLSRRWGIDPE